MNIDFMPLGPGIENADECFALAENNSFCGNMVLLDFDNHVCVCIATGKEKSCSKETSRNNWVVYKSGTLIRLSQLTYIII